MKALCVSVLFYKIVLCYIKNARHIIVYQNIKILPLIIVIKSGKDHESL